MSIVFIKNIAPHTKIGLWKIECSEHLESACPPSARRVILGKCKSRQTETFAVYSLLKEMTGRDNLIIEHEPSGRPFITTFQDEGEKPLGWNIGISHTKGYAAVILSEDDAVSVDIEYRSARIEKIADRFLRNDENDNIKKLGNENGNIRTTRLLLYWCAKETVYKYFSDTRLTFQNICVEYTEKDDVKEGCFSCKNIINGETLDIHYIQNENFVMTWCKK